MRTVAGWVVPMCWLTFAVVWIAGAFTAKPAARGQGGPRRWWYRVGIIAVLLLFATWRPRGTPNVTLWAVGWGIVIGADAITIAGLAVAIWARVALGVYWSGNVVVKDAHVIIDRGPYRLVRHPIYFGVLLMLLGTMLAWGTRDGVVMFVVVLVGLLVKARFEERLLSDQFPVEYGSYKARVTRALIPWLL